MIRPFVSRALPWRYFTLVIWLAALCPALSAQSKLELKIKRHAPCNLFDIGKPVRFDADIRSDVSGEALVTAVLVDETGREYATRSLGATVTAGVHSVLSVDVGQPGRGYYELKLKAVFKGAGEIQRQADASCSLGVMDFVHRSADQVREQGYIFGLKWWGGIQRQSELMDALCDLGLQWTRIIQNEGGNKPNRLSSVKILADYPMNAVVKIERFPAECYDAERYGPIDEWEKKYGRGSWTLKTLPKKEPYQAWLRKQIALLPPSQQVFEVWNEPWDKLSPEDCATLCQWVAEAITKDRPNAIIGPNLYGSASPYEYDAHVIAAGGMKGMKMVALHPYAVSEDREWLRDYREWLKTKLGHDVDIYITEYGSPSTPEGPAKRTEREQARRVVRQSISLYAEGVKALTPHWAGQSEQNPTYLEDWFGFVRKNEEPKPVLLAHANCARLIDGSRYLGDLWLGPRVAAMVFEKNNVRTLALWTLGETDSTDENVRPTKEISLRPGAGQLTLVDMMGREKSLRPVDGGIKLTLTDAPVYLVGIGADCASTASRELRPDRWPKPAKPPRTVRKAMRMKTPPTLDGAFADWQGVQTVALLNPRVNGDDCSGMAYLGWDDTYLYVGVDVRDNELFNKEIRKYLYRGDSVELFLSTEPRASGGGFGPHDHQFILAPTSGEGKPIIGVVTDRSAGIVEDIPGARFFAGTTSKGRWALEVALPWSALNGFTPKPGATLSLDLRLNDADTSHKRFKVDPIDAAADFNVSDPSTWSLLNLEQ